MQNTTKQLDLYKQEIRQRIYFFLDKNGPEETDYEQFDQLMEEIGDMRREGVFNETDILELQQFFGEPMTTTQTLQGQVCVKQYGYPGDFQIIDCIYTHHISPDKMLSRWDHYFQAQAASKAVRNRKEYFKSLLAAKPENTAVLNLVSGPCRDIAEYLQQHPGNKMMFDCLEFDLEAIKYAKQLLDEHGITHQAINFIPKNIFKFEPTRRYDFIWSAGLFDYLEDEVVVEVLSGLSKILEKGGEIVIGNFHTKNPSRNYMEFGQWYLYHRTEEQLVKLAELSGASPECIRISKESEDVNLFLHINLPA
ncbi:class I SAM-dependent methyltransferase [Fulvivirgaceae bacterium BMA12]|uniref:Class I SAM-dependent methyltransferase n=1 Tax=Agaribacillus aureus TaxID=3051825 RepID=A0ABT8KZY9_9BACT|nr:class I SAM-dependent methyltransferase [Fulvivirgaceae bacterium BMA12]